MTIKEFREYLSKEYWMALQQCESRIEEPDGEYWCGWKDHAKNVLDTFDREVSVSDLERGKKIPDLKPCPLCGGKAMSTRTSRKWDGESIRDAFVVQCTSCGLQTSSFSSNIRLRLDGELEVTANGAVDAVNAWNRRAGEEHE